MKKIVLLIAVFLVFSSAYAQHYFTLPQLEKICYKLNNDDIYAVRDYVQNVGYTALKVDDFYTFDDKFDSVHAYAASMTHNTFVQVLINLGLVGTFIMILQLMTTFFAITIEKDKWLLKRVLSYNHISEN